ncbi:MAG: hypothetical protein PVI59_10875 [Anaerolineae bacterium]|jgi:hypothetical protein
MLSIKYPANFVSGIYVLPVAEVLTVAQPTTEDPQIKAIKTQLNLAQTHYRKGQYRPAISAYKSAQALIHRLLNPNLPVATYLADDALMLPTTINIERKLAEASLKMVELIQPQIGLPSSPVTVADVEMPPEVARLDAIGFHREVGLPVKVQDKTALGIQLLNGGRVQQAIHALEDANRLITQPVTLEAKASAGAATLNLSSAYLLAGDYGRAKRLAVQAKQHFVGADDKLGQAQALHNEAIALKRTCQLEEAEERSAEAADLYQRIAKEWRTATRNPTSANPKPGAARPAASALTLKAGAAALTSVLQPSTELEELSFIAEKDTSSVALRWPGLGAGWGKVALLTPAEAERQSQTWSLGIEVGTQVVNLTWVAGQQPAAADLLQSVYQPRVAAEAIKDLVWRPNSDGELSAYLTHLYAFVIPQALGDCYHALGDFARAEQYYLQAAGYTYINRNLEVPALWARLATNYVDWGDRLYKQESIDECQTIYARLITRDGAAPDDSPLYTLAVFAGPAADAQQLIAHLDDPSGVDINPAIAWPILVAWARWQHLLAGLDFYGIEFIPIFTFEYLQQVARAFAQQAIQAEREYINFQTRAEAEAATRRELEGAAAMAEAEADGRLQQYLASVEESQALDKAKDLADLRHQQAIEERNEYASAGYWQYVTQSIATAHGAGESWYGSEIRRIAAKIEEGDWRGESKKKAGAAAVLLGGQKSYEYQLERLQNDIDELNAMRPIAQDQAQAAEHREEAARIAWLAAVRRGQLAQDALAAFDNEVFTPELWTRLAQAMQRLSAEYRDWAIRVAKRMERAYNFETDSQLRVIKNEYPAGDTNGLLAADYLLRDVESFTYHYIAHQRSKETHVKDVISLVNEYPFQFYSLQGTGQMTFETLLYDFDRRHPGLHSQRIKAVEVEIVGLLPQEGVRGTLRGGGLSRYRTVDGDDKSRIHTVDTMALSEYILRNDAFVYRADPRMHGLFEGHGVATSWQLSLPRRSNNLDYRLIADVRLVLYYSARYSEALGQVVVEREPLPGEMIHVRDFQLRYDFPEVWYGFLDSGQITFNVDEAYLPRNETNFRTDKVALRLITAEGESPADVEITLTLPDQDSVVMTTDADGEVAAEEGNDLAAVMGGPLLGDWSLEVQPPDGSSLLDDEGNLRGDLIEQIALVVQYEFDWPE